MQFLPAIKNFFNWPITRIVIATALLYLVFRQANLTELATKLATVHPGWLVFALVGSLLMAWVAGWRWALILVQRPIELKDHWLFFRATMLGLFYNLFMPSSMGGDVLKWTTLDQLDLPKSQVILTMLIDRVMGLLGLVTLGFGGLVIGHLTGLVQMPILMWQVMSAAFAGVVGFLVLISTDWRWRQIPILNRWKWIGEAEAHLEKHRIRFWAAFGLSLLVQLLGVLIEYGLGLAVGFKLGLVEFLIIAPLLGAAVALPLNFAGFGATEVGFVYFFGLMGEAPATVLALTSLMAAIRFMVGGLGWLVGLINQKTPVKQN